MIRWRIRYQGEIQVQLHACISLLNWYHPRNGVFTALHDKTVERSVQIFIPYERTFSLVFWEEEWLVGGDHFYLKFWVNWPSFEQIRWFSTDIRP